MPLHVVRFRLAQLMIAALACLGWSASTAQAQFRLFHDWRKECLDAIAPSTPEPSDPKKTPVTQAEPLPSALTTAALSSGQTSFGPPPGYLDYAVPSTYFRLRVDAAYDNTRPDRAEYFYAKCGCFKMAGIDPKAPGPIGIETQVDYQDVAAYLEVAANERLSGFIEVPLRFLNPTVNENTYGLADMNLGFKYAIINDGCRYLTFQGRLFVPTGAASHGLGTHHASFEPSLLYQQKLGERVTLFGQFGDWIPVGGTNFSGNILRYGVGAGYTLSQGPSLTITPIAELMGWSLLSGMESVNPPGTLIDSAGETILNAKFGVRFYWSEQCSTRLLANSDLYVGYGRAITGDRWYSDIFRIEYRVRF